MGCVYSDFQGVCELWDKDGVFLPEGCDDDGNCLCEDDPDPEESCEQYKSDDDDQEDF